MPSEFSATVNATSNGTVNTQDTFLELSAVILGVKRIRARLGDGTATAGVDNDWRIDIVRKTAGGTGTTAAGTAVRLNKMGAASGATVTQKSGTNNFTTATIDQTIDTAIVNGRAIFEWVARDEDDFIRNHITLGSGGMIGILIQSAVVSQKFQVSAYWVEY